MALLYFFIGTVSPVMAISKKPGTSLFENGWSQRQEIETRTPPTLDPTACEATEGISATGQSLVGDPNCVGLAYPNVKDEAKLEKGINDYIQKLKPNSPLAGKANVFIEAGKKWGINPMFMVNIGRMETQFATDGGSGIKKGTFNPFGIGCRKGPTDGGAGEGNCIGRFQVFNSFESSLFGLGQVLREVYLDKGLRTAETVFPKYAPPFENDTDEYVKQVNGWMQEVSSLVGDGIECNGSAGSPITTTPSTPAAANSTNQASNVVSSDSQKGQTWVLGDSLTYGMYNFGALSQKLNDQGYSPNKVNFQSGRSIKTGGSGTTGSQSPGSGLQAVEADKEFIKNSKNIVIALGSNAETVGDFSKNQKELIDKIKSYNPNANIRWVDIAAVGGKTNSYNKNKAQERNELIYKNTGLGYTPISQFKFVWGDDQDPTKLASKSLPDPNKLLSTDGIHYNGVEPYSKFATFLAAQMSNSVSQSGAQTVVVLDPGHSGQDLKNVDQQSGLKDIDYANYPEIDQVWDTTQKVKAKLEQAGYKVILTKNSARDSVSLRQRANIADTANAAISVSIHNDQQYEFNSWGEVYVQKVGLFRGDSPKVEFKDTNVAERSQRYGNIMVEARKKAENNPSIVVKDNTFDNRGEIEPGNIPLILLFSKVPWVYNEAGGKGYDSEKYADGIFNGIKNSVPPGSQQPAEELSCEKSGASASASGSKQSVVDTANSAFERNQGISEYEGEILQFSDGNREPWCADFVSWVYKNAGLPFSGGSSGGWRIPGVLSMQAFFKNTTGYEYFEVGQKQPEPGDVAFYVGNQTPDGGSTQHVNIVIAVSGSTMTTIGGNEGNQVKKSERAIKLGENSLVGFGRKLN
jgi:N-acetylmuramoyl-L-alanine amidase